jgi:PAS domain S-box-containing protein
MSLRWRITIAIAALLASASLILTYVFHHEVMADHKNDHVSWAATLSNALAKAILRDTLEGKRAEVRNTLNRVTESNPDLFYLAVIGFDGKPFASTFDRELPPELARLDHRNCLPGSSHAVQMGQQNVHDIAYPLIDNLEAHLHLGLNEEAFTRSVSQATVKTVVAAFIILLLAIAAAIILSRRISRPLTQLTDSVEAFGRGEVFDKKHISGGDTEVRKLVDSFDRMVHERQKTDASLRQFKSTLDRTLDCVFMFTADSLRFFYLNQGAVDQVGYSQEELLQMRPFDIKPDFDEAQFRQLIAPMLAGKQTFINFETRHRHKDGHDVPVEIALQYVAPAGEPPRFVAIVRDISERKRVDAELSRYREHLEEMVAARTGEVREQARIIDQIHGSIVTTDLEGFVSGWNKGAERLFGYTAAEAMGRHIGFLYPPQEQQFLRDQVIAPLQAHGQHETEVRMRRKDGTIFSALLSLSLLHDDDGKPRGMVGYSTDISARKRAEALAEERATELETFSYSVSHDLRTPLRAIDGFSRILLEDHTAQLDPEARSHLDRIRKAVLRMGTLIDDLLELSRVGRTEMRLSDVNLTRLANEQVEQLRAGDAARAVEVSIAADLAGRGDENLLRLVLQNLLGNAWKYTRFTADARIEFSETLQNGETVYTIRDNGAGFDMAYANKLFLPFERLHRSDKFEGTGIGLATVARIIHRHGGRVWAEAETDKGAGFHFTLGRGGRE